MPKPRADFRPVRPPEPLDRSGLQDPLNHTRLVRYRRAVMEAHGSIGFAGLPTRVEESGRDVPLAALFVVPRLSPAPTPPEAFDQSPPPVTADAYAALREHQRLVVLGDPGAGKTTLVSWIASSLCAPGGGGELASHLGAPYIPFVFTLRELTIPAQPSWPGLLAAFLAQLQSEALAESSELVGHLLTIGQAFIILDGLDELGDAAWRGEVREAVWEGMNAYPRCRWLLTSRIVGYDEARFDCVDFDEEDIKRVPIEARVFGSLPRGGSGYQYEIATPFYLAPFADDQIREFAGNWWRQNSANPVLAASDPAKFCTALAASPGTRTLARIPNILVLVCFLYRTDAELPDGRWIIYRRIAEAYLRTIGKAKGIASPLPHEWTTHHRWLAAIAWDMQRARASGFADDAKAEAVLVRQETIVRLLQHHICACDGVNEQQADETAKKFLLYVSDRSGLFVPRAFDANGNHLYAFSHLSFQEYFAAAYLCEAVTDPDWQEREEENASAGTTLADLRIFTAKPLWWEVLIFLFEGVSEVNPRHPASLLIRILGWKRLCNEWSDGLDLTTISTLARPWNLNQENIAGLLAMLVVNPQITFDGTVGWEGPVRAALWCRCWQRQLEQQQSADGDKVYFVKSGLPSLLLARVGAMERGVKMLVDAARNLPELQSLDLENCHGLTDLSWLATFPMLKFLRLTACDQVRDFSPLATLENLQTLAVGLCSIGARPDWLSGLQQLRVLRLNGCPGLADLTPLQSLTYLRSLYLPNNRQLTTLSPLQALTKLTYLDLSDCLAITDLTALCGLKYLSQLWVLQCRALSKPHIMQISYRLPACRFYSDYGTILGGNIFR